MSIEKEMDVIVRAIKGDPGYRQAWVSNIAVCFQDEMRKWFNKNLHEISNQAANNFLDVLCLDKKEPEHFEAEAGVVLGWAEEGA